MRRCGPGSPVCLSRASGVVLWSSAGRRGSPVSWRRWSRTGQSGSVAVRRVVCRISSGVRVSMRQGGRVPRIGPSCVPSRARTKRIASAGPASVCSGRQGGAFAVGGDDGDARVVAGAQVYAQAGAGGAVGHGRHVLVGLCPVGVGLGGDRWCCGDVVAGELRRRVRAVVRPFLGVGRRPRAAGRVLLHIAVAIAGRGCLRVRCPGVRGRCRRVCVPVGEAGADGRLSGFDRLVAVGGVVSVAGVEDPGVLVGDVAVPDQGVVVGGGRSR